MPFIHESAIAFTTLLVGLLTTGVLLMLPSTWQGDGRALRYWVIGNLALSLERVHALTSSMTGGGAGTLLVLPLATACVATGAAMHVAAMRMLLQPERRRLDWRWPGALGLTVALLGWLLADPVLPRIVLSVGTSLCIVLMLTICWPRRRQLRGALVMSVTMLFFLAMNATGILELGRLAAKGIPDVAPPTPTAILALDLVLSVVVNLAFLLILIELLQQHVERLSVTDALTGVLNRRGFLQAAKLQLLHADRMRYSHRGAAALLLDLDHFKRINDSLGHPMGDAVLRGAAERVAGAVRQTDVLARWGGEEFVVLLPGTLPAHARDVAERIRQAVERAPLAEGAPVVTVSIGVAALHDALVVDRLPALIAEADRRLYLAKRQRNCVVADGAGPPQGGSLHADLPAGDGVLAGPPAAVRA